MALTRCPECGADLTGRDPREHALSHWQEHIPIRPDTEEARKRQKLLLDAAEELQRPPVRKGG